MNATTNLVYYVGDRDEWQVEAVKKIFSFQSLVKNWDSYGSEPIAQGAISLAMDLINHVGFGNVPAPRVIPVSGGGIQLEWVKGNRELEVEVHPNGTIEYLSAYNGEPTGEAEVEPREALPEAERLLSWLSAG